MVILENYEEFSNVLSNRFHTVLSHLENISGKFTAFIQAINRSDSKKLEQKTLSYIGLKEQKRRLSNEDSLSDFDPTKEEDRSWIFLSETDFREKPIGSYTFYHNFRLGKLKIEDVQLNSLKDYFKEITNDPQKAEYIILSKYFDIDSSHFITLPLIQFGDFDGLVYVVFEEKDFNLYKLKDVKIRIIKNFSIEYEKLLLEWGKITTKNYNSDLNTLLSFLQSDKYYELINTNPILESLNFQQYYLESNVYYRSSLTRLSKQINEDKKVKYDAYDEKSEISTLWEIPDVLKTAFHQFLVYFTDYVKNIHKITIDFRIETHPKGLKLFSKENYTSNITLLDNLLSEYLEVFLTQSYSAIDEDERSFQNELELFTHKQRIRELKMENEFLKLRIEDQLEKQKLINSILGKTEDELKMKVSFFKSPEISLIAFSKRKKELDVYKESTIAKVNMKEKLYQEVRSKLEFGEISNALQLLSKYFESEHETENHNKIILLKSRFESINSDRTLGVIKDSIFFKEKARIINSILHILSQ